MGDGTCLLDVAANVDETWLLGQPFLMNYYSIWDNGNAQVGLTPHRTSQASVIATTVSPLPERVFTIATIWDTVVLISEVTAGVVGIVGVLSAAGLIVFVILYQTGIIQTPIMDLSNLAESKFDLYM